MEMGVRYGTVRRADFQWIICGVYHSQKLKMVLWVCWGNNEGNFRNC
jgi:hypothetical protein